MTIEQSIIDDHCHICQAETQWFLTVHMNENIHVKIALCDLHRPKLVEIYSKENKGLISHIFDQQKLVEIHYGGKKETFKMTGPEAPGLGIRRPL